MISLLKNVGGVGEAMALPAQVVSHGTDGTAFAQLLLMADTGSDFAEARDQKAAEPEAGLSGDIAKISQAADSPIVLQWTASPLADNASVTMPKPTEPEGGSQSAKKPASTENRLQKSRSTASVEVLTPILPVRTAGLGAVQIPPSAPPATTLSNPIADPKIQTEESASRFVSSVTHASLSADAIFVGADTANFPNEAPAIVAGDNGSTSEIEPDPVAPILPIRTAGLGAAQIPQLTPPATTPSNRITDRRIQAELSASRAVNPVTHAFRSVDAILVGANAPGFPNEALAIVAGGVISASEAKANPAAKALRNHIGLDNVISPVTQQPFQLPELAKPGAAAGDVWQTANPFAPADARMAETLRAAAYFDALANDIVAATISHTRTNFRISTENLGIVGIGVDPSPNGISVQITTRGDEAAAVIAAAQPRLHEELRAQGVRVSEQQGQSLDRQPTNDRERPPQHRFHQPDHLPPEPDDRRNERSLAQSNRFA